MHDNCCIGLSETLEGAPLRDIECLRRLPSRSSSCTEAPKLCWIELGKWCVDGWCSRVRSRLYRDPRLGSAWCAARTEPGWSNWGLSAAGEGGWEAGGQITKGLTSLVKGLLTWKNSRVAGEFWAGRVTRFDLNFPKIHVVELSPPLLVNWTYQTTDVFAFVAGTIFFLTPRVRGPKKLNIRGIFTSVLLPQLTRGIRNVVFDLGILLEFSFPWRYLERPSARWASRAREARSRSLERLYFCLTQATEDSLRGRRSSSVPSRKFSQSPNFLICLSTVVTLKFHK